MFYPGQLLFLLPLPFYWTFNAYLVGHVLLAAGGGYRLARHWQADAVGAGLAALSYAFGGCVLFQYCNVVYLVGAAWLPWAVWHADLLRTVGSLRAIVGLGTCLSLMVLGGDPQMAYHTVLLAALGFLLQRDLASSMTDTNRGRPRSCWWALILALFIGLGLSAVQVFPSWEFARQSDRAAFTLPRSAYELPSYFARRSQLQPEQPGNLAWYAGLIGTVDTPGAHHRSIYRFSVPPWRWIEFVWPNVSGRSFPIHRRWMAAWPAETEVWVPSMYAGLLPLLLGLLAFSLRQGPWPRRWMSWCLLLAMLASLGAYGPTWVVNEALAAVTPAADPAGQPDPEALRWSGGTGGLYWLLKIALPGYVQFRYPAKWLVVASLALSMLAAFGWQISLADGHRPARRWLTVVLGLSLLALCVVVGLRGLWPNLLAGTKADPWFGPFDAEGAWLDLLVAILHGTILAALLLALLSSIVTPARANRAWLVVVVTTIDLAGAQSWMLGTVPRQIFESSSQGAALIEQAQNHFTDSPLERIDRRGLWLNDAWLATSDDDRLSEVVRWQRDTLWPKYPLTDQLAMTIVSSTFMPLDFRMVLDTLQPQVDTERRESEFWNLLNVRYVLNPTSPDHEHSLLDDGLPSVGRIQFSEPRQEKPVPVRRRETTWPRAWIVHQFECLAPIDEADLQAVASRTMQVFGTVNPADDLRRRPVVETNDSVDIFPPGFGVDSSENESCKIVIHRPTLVTLEVRLDTPGLIVLADRYDAGWQARVQTNGQATSRPVPVWRTNRVQRGVWLPAGEHRLTYRYRPASFYWGLTLSSGTLALLGGGALVIRLRRTNRCSASPRRE